MKLLFQKKWFKIIASMSLIINSVFAVDISQTSIKNTQILDVRTTKELKDTGVIGGSFFVELISDDGKFNDNFVNDVLNTGIDKNSKISVLCNSGRRSAIATQMLQKAGFTNVVNLKGGIQKLLSTGYKTEDFKK